MKRIDLTISPGFVRNFVFLGMIALSLASLLYSGRLAASLERQTDTFTDLFARFAAVATLPASQDEEVHRVFRGFMDRVDLPIIVTDRRGVPWTCKGVGMSPDAIPYDLFMSTDPLNPPPGPMSHLLRLAWEMDTERSPIPMIRPDTGETFGFVHYRESPLVDQLRLMPILQIGIAGFLVVLGYLGVRSVRQSEKRSILVGMAKETAHQLGTPLSSLLGWVELLEAEAGPEDAARLETLREMRADISRLGQVARRFERIGSQPKLAPREVNPILEEVVQYLRRRLPSRGHRIEIVEQYTKVPAVETDPELLAWTVENLLRNAVDAIMRSGQGGRIAIRTSPALPTGVRIVIEDDGPGIPDALQSRIFDPGFTTKKRGWGLGLALARRIVCEYHQGRIRLLRSTPGVRTVFVVDLPEKVPGRSP